MAGSISLTLELTALVAERDRPESDRYRVRWLQRWLEERSSAPIDELAMVASSLAALGGERHVEALNLLRSMATP